MAANCLNCERPIAENFCSYCGQKKYKRIDRKYIWDEIQYSVLHTNKGFLYSVKNLLKNPGKTAREYIEGNRVNHYKPILLAFVLSGISAFISFKVLGFQQIMREALEKNKAYNDLMADIISFTSSYNSFIMLLLVPFFAVFSIIAFKRWGNNYYEHVVMNAYVVSYYTLVNILIIYPVMYLFRYNESVFMSFMWISTALIPFILLWFFKGYYASKSFKSILGRVLLILLMLGMAYILFIVMMVFGILIVKGPDAFKYAQPH